MECIKILWILLIANNLLSHSVFSRYSYMIHAVLTLPIRDYVYSKNTRVFANYAEYFCGLEIRYVKVNILTRNISFPYSGKSTNDKNGHQIPLTKLT